MGWAVKLPDGSLSEPFDTAAEAEAYADEIEGRDERSSEEIWDGETSPRVKRDVFLRRIRMGWKAHRALHTTPDGRYLGVSKVKSEQPHFGGLHSRGHKETRFDPGVFQSRRLVSEQARPPDGYDRRHFRLNGKGKRMIRMLRKALGTVKPKLGVIGRVSVSNAGKSVIEIGHGFEDGTWEKITDGGHVALSPEEREELIKTLESHREYQVIELGDTVAIEYTVVAVQYLNATAANCAGRSSRTAPGSGSGPCSPPSRTGPWSTAPTPTTGSGR